jgi:hypothetical protein
MLTYAQTLIKNIAKLPSTIEVLMNTDLIKLIFSQTNIVKGSDFKALIITCKLWHGLYVHIYSATS